MPTMRDRIRKYCNTQEDVEEIISEGFRKVLTYIHQYSGVGSFEGWMSIILKRTALDHLKRRRKLIENRGFPVELDSDMIFREESNLALVKDYFYKVTEILPQVHKKVFILFSDGHSHEEIGELVGISEGTSKWYLHEARRIIKEKIGNSFKIPEKSQE